MADDFGSAPREQEVILAWFRKLNSSDRIALAATVFALISLVVSIKSCQQADRTLVMAQRDFEGARSLIWTGEVKEKNKLCLNHSNPDAIIETVWLVFPKVYAIGDLDEFGPSGELTSSNRVVPLQILHDKINAEPFPVALYKESPNSSPFSYQARSIEMSVPIAIETRYIVKGEHRLDRSLYFLPYYFNFRGTPITDSSGLAIYTDSGPVFGGTSAELRFERMRFAGRIDEKDSREVIERLSKKDNPAVTNGFRLLPQAQTNSTQQ